MISVVMNSLRVAGILLAASAACAARTQEKKLVVIVHASNPVDSLRPQQIRDLFLKKHPTWRGELVDVGDRKGFDETEVVKPVDLPGNTEERRAFLSKVLEMSAASLERYWVKVQYQSATEPPAQADNSDRAIRLVGSQKGGLAFVAESALTEETRKKVKVVYTVTLD